MMTTVGVLMLLSAPSAFAQNATLESRMPFTVAGPLGISVVAIGVGGLVLGLWRHRRKSVKQARVQSPAQVRVKSN
jgi:hypothetical protein